ncbi:MAG: hypothetical protein A4E60_00973 [Syntrophorhabdus sp. PtaB.Bin047]|jgi:hypothetical protein|nr:MAG: hypothetical protein A4E60_00973 [Syntrophorhabdus sp. PtaB.Bin047]
MTRAKQRLMAHKQQTATCGYPVKTGNPTGKATRYPNGDVWCQQYSDRIDHAVCITRAVRHPEMCKGCPLNLQGRREPWESF